MRKSAYLPILALLAVMPWHLVHAQVPSLLGFLDGTLYAPDGTYKYICFLNNDCLAADGTITTRQALGLSPLPVTDIAVSAPIATSTPPNQTNTSATFTPPTPSPEPQMTEERLKVLAGCPNGSLDFIPTDTTAFFSTCTYGGSYMTFWDNFTITMNGQVVYDGSVSNRAQVWDLTPDTDYAYELNYLGTIIHKTFHTSK